MDTNLDILIGHYSKIHKNKIFSNKMMLTNGNPGIMFFYDTEKELVNFKECFGYYLPIYVQNEDFIETMDITGDIDDKLTIYSKRTWNDSTLVPHRETSISGIYGELFLDIYLRLVCDRKILLSYGSKRGYSLQSETKGIDSIGYVFNGNNIELYLSEAKFVGNKHDAKRSLLNDISKGEIPHLRADYLNKYFGFVLKKDLSCPKQDRKIISGIFADINRRINSIDNPEKFVDIIIDKNIKINFVCFAIFQDKPQNPDDLNMIYDELMQEIKNQFSILGISNYGYEIVFIPTKNKSMIIKEEINSFYEWNHD